MAKKISELATATTPLSGSELVEIVQGGTSKKVSASNLTGSIGREILTADRTYYVRTDGSNSNNGLANTSGGAFLTIQKALDAIALLDMSAFACTVQVGDGTYTGTSTVKQILGGSSITIQGNATTPDNVLISTTSAACFSNLIVGVSLTVKNLKMTTTTGGDCLAAESGGKIIFSNVTFGACALSHVSARSNGLILCNSDYKIVGAAVQHFFAGTGGEVTVYSNTITITGTPAFSNAFSFANLQGRLQTFSNTFSGSATGKRYDISTNSVCYTGGGGTTYFPGNVSGTTATGGQYV